ncbi:MAG TPA: hypothetical protein PLO64_00570 [Methanothermobacter sp.]|nr:hypothetical protein [Methanothermobacter sp.]HOK72109.1 hypothetical protein [Methanothermobacter sp.]HOL68422.1 hypothetical protein [Methanothermobacter sp.]HPQ04180.1 hypothetical protein [Methanothermobacter sp.]HPU37828.1 hypothetical protein [Methanothermobacter sp.]
MALKDLILGYRKIKRKSLDELAKELEVPKTVVEGLENGEIKHPTPALLSKIKKLVWGLDEKEIEAIGRGYRIKDFLGNYFTYFLKGLSKEKGIETSKIQKMPPIELYKLIGTLKEDFIKITDEGRRAAKT